MNFTPFQQKTFLLLLFFVTLAFGWVLWPFFSVIFWATVLAILFSPLYRKLLNITQQRENLAAFATLLFCLIMVILPFTLIAASLIQQAVGIYQNIRSGELSFATYFQQVLDALPAWIVNLLHRAELTNLSGLNDMLSSGALQGSQIIAAQAFTIGQNTFEFIIGFFIMLYLLFFLLRDGPILTSKLNQAIPLSTEHKWHLFNKFIMVVRATVKGNLAVAAIQGTLGGIVFAFLDIQGALLWGSIMAFLSLLPAGAGVIWGPIAIYSLLTGDIWQGITLILFGIFVIGLIDNLLRPILVGSDTQLPDYVVFISTLGGMALFGLNGFIIGPVIAALFIAAWDLFSMQIGKEKP